MPRSSKTPSTEVNHAATLAGQKGGSLTELLMGAWAGAAGTGICSSSIVSANQKMREIRGHQFGGINSTRAESRLTIFLSCVTGGFSPYINGLLYYNVDIQRPRCRASTKVQKVDIDGHLSSEKIFNISVIQGSILGLILFLIYINDL